MRPATTLTLGLLLLLILDGRRHLVAAPLAVEGRPTVNLAHIIDGHAPDHVAIISRGVETTYGELRDQVGLGTRRPREARRRRAGDRVALLCGNGLCFVEAYLAAARPRRRRRADEPAEPCAGDRSGNRHSRRQGRRRRTGSSRARGTASTAPRSRRVRVRDRGRGPVEAGNKAAVEPTRPTTTSSRPIRVDAVDVEPDTSARADLHQRHGRLAHGGDAQPRQPAGQHRPGPLGAPASSSPTTSSTACCRCSTSSGSTSCSALTLAPAPPSCSSSGSTRRPRSTRSASAASRSSPARRRCGWRSATSTTRRPTASPTVRLALTGAAKMPEEASAGCSERFGLELAEGYGLTEASPVVTSSAGIAVARLGRQGARRRRGAAGRRGRRRRARRRRRRDLGAGPNVFHGYWDDPEPTARVLDRRRLAAHRRHRRRPTTTATCTSSTGPRTSSSSSGFNVFPAEVEEVLAEHPGVAEVGVVGVPHPHTGEAVKAYVVARAGATRRGRVDRLVPATTWPATSARRRSCSSIAAAERRRQAAAPLADRQRRQRRRRRRCAGARGTRRTAR